VVVGGGEGVAIGDDIVGKLEKWVKEVFVFGGGFVWSWRKR
jgi:hypothetical protein